MKLAKAGIALFLLIAAGFLVRRQMRTTPSNVEQFSYDSAGRLKGRITRNGAKISYDYDSQGKLTKIHYPDWRSQSSFVYNDAGELVATHDRSGLTQLQRDAFGRLAKMVSPSGQAISYQYDPGGRLSAVNLGGQVDFTY